MGNCQAAEAATVVIQHPGNKIERIYWSVSAHVVMNSNPGHYVALLLSSPTSSNSHNATPLKQLKLLRPDDTLLLGQVYRLISFEDVLKEFASKKCGKLGKLLKERGGNGVQMKHRDSTVQNPSPSSKFDSDPTKVEQEIHRMGSNGSSSSNNKGVGRHFISSGGGQWRPALHSIAEIGT